MTAFEHLTELAGVLKRLTGHPPGTIEPPADTDPDLLQSRFLRGLNTGIWADDRAAAADLYGTNESDQRYRTLRTRTSDKIHNSLAMCELESDRYSEYSSAYIRCKKLLLASPIFMSTQPQSIHRVIKQSLLDNSYIYSAYPPNRVE